MSKVHVDQYGQLICPHCGASSFENEKEPGDLAPTVAAAGPLGMFRKKRLRCMACGKKSDLTASPPNSSAATVSPPRVRGSSSSAAAVESPPTAADGRPGEPDRSPGSGPTVGPQGEVLDSPATCVVILDSGPNKISVIKEVRELGGLSLKAAKKAVENASHTSPFRMDLADPGRASAALAVLEAEGAVCELG